MQITWIKPQEHEYARYFDRGTNTGARNWCICSVQCRNRDNSGIVLRKIGIPTLCADSRIVPDNSRIAQGIHVVLWANMVSAQSRNRRGQSKNLKGRIS